MERLNLRLRFNAGCANLLSNPRHHRPLQIGVLSVAFRGIIIAAQKLALRGGHRVLPAGWTSGCHSSKKECSTEYTICTSATNIFALISWGYCVRNILEGSTP